MINYFSILLSHALIAWACWRLLSRDDLDDNSVSPPADTATRRPGSPSAPAATRKGRGRA